MVVYSRPLASRRYLLASVLFLVSTLASSPSGIRVSSRSGTHRFESRCTVTWLVLLCLSCNACILILRLRLSSAIRSLMSAACSSFQESPEKLLHKVEGERRIDQKVYISLEAYSRRIYSEINAFLRVFCAPTSGFDTDLYLLRISKLVLGRLRVGSVCNRCQILP